jgi:predicted DNA-binding protein
MPTKHPMLSVIIYPDTGEAIEEMMKKTGRRKSTIIKEALDIGVKAMLQSPTAAQQKLVRSPQEQANALLEKLLASDRDLLNLDECRSYSDRIICQNLILEAMTQWFEENQGVTSVSQQAKVLLEQLRQLLEE